MSLELRAESLGSGNAPVAFDIEDDERIFFSQAHLQTFVHRKRRFDLIAVQPKYLVPQSEDSFTSADMKN
jgi:hypothetical protein